MQNDVSRLCPSCQRPVPATVDYCPFDGSPVGSSHPLESAAAVASDEPGFVPATTHGMDPFIGYALLNRYLLLERVGQGGFATVYRAEKMGTGTNVAVKLVTKSRRDDETIAKRFEREGQILNAFSHPNAVGIVECGITDEGLAYIVMEFVEGETLRNVIANESPLALPRIEAILLQVGAAITAAHKSGIVHRDLKPENVMILQTPSGEVAKVLDFGVARLRSAETADGRITANDLIVGTPRYLAPEALIEGVQTTASDVYTLGIVAYEMLTGRVPFEPKVGENTVEVAVRLAKQQPPPPSGHNSQLSAEIDAVILKCIARNPADRYETPTDFAEAIASAVEAVLSNAEMTDPLSRSMPALRPDQILGTIQDTIKGVPAIRDEAFAQAPPPPADATIVGMPAIPGSAPLASDYSASPATVVGMPALPPSAPLPAAPATVVGMPALPPSAPLPPAAATVVGMPALPPSAPLPAAPATVVGMPALPSNPPRKPDVPDAAATVVGMPALPTGSVKPADVPDAAATVVGMPALSSIPGMQKQVQDASATVVHMPALTASSTVAQVDSTDSVTGKDGRAVNPMVIVVVLVIVAAIVVAALYLLK